MQAHACCLVLTHPSLSLSLSRSRSRSLALLLSCSLALALRSLFPAMPLRISSQHRSATANPTTITGAPTPPPTSQTPTTLPTAAPFGGGDCDTHQDCIAIGFSYCFDHGMRSRGAFDGIGKCSFEPNRCCVPYQPPVEEGKGGGDLRRRLDDLSLLPPLEWQTDSITRSIDGCPAASQCFQTTSYFKIHSHRPLVRIRYSN